MRKRAPAFAGTEPVDRLSVGPGCMPRAPEMVTCRSWGVEQRHGIRPLGSCHGAASVDKPGSAAVCDVDGLHKVSVCQQGCLHEHHSFSGACDAWRCMQSLVSMCLQADRAFHPTQQACKTKHKDGLDCSGHATHEKINGHPPPRPLTSCTCVSFHTPAVRCQWLQACMWQRRSGRKGQAMLTAHSACAETCLGGKSI